MLDDFYITRNIDGKINPASCFPITAVTIMRGV